jgi:hypothetical protein
MDYFVKIRVPNHDPPIDDGDYEFSTCHYAAEPDDDEAFQTKLDESYWKIGFNQGDWEKADRVWIFKEIYDDTKIKMEIDK